MPENSVTTEKVILKLMFRKKFKMFFYLYFYYHYCVKTLNCFNKTISSLI